MGSLSISEILTIVVVILVIFGPDKLPEMSRKLGQLIRKGRETVASFTTEIESEYGDAVTPITDLTTELGAVKKDLTDSVAKLGAVDKPAAEEPETMPPAEPVDLSDELKNPTKEEDSAEGREGEVA